MENIEKRQGNKKVDANGNDLSENIGIGINVNHPDKELKELLIARQEFLLSEMGKKELREIAKNYGGVGAYLRKLIKADKNK